MFRRTALAGAAVFVLSVLAVSACSKKGQTKTTIPATWRNPEFTGEPFSKLFVVGVGRNGAYRRLYEDNMVHALEGLGAMAEASWVTFPENDKLDAAKLVSTLRDGNFDAIVITRLLSVDEETKYVPGKPPTSSELYMAGYDKAYAVNSDPGYYETNTRYTVETALYSTRDGMVVWLVQSETVDPDSVEEVIQSVSSRVAQQMKADGLLR